MDEIKKISLEYLQKISAEQQFNLKLKKIKEKKEA